MSSIDSLTSIQPKNRIEETLNSVQLPERTTPAHPSHLVQQQNDARKISPYYIDTLSVHPDAHLNNSNKVQIDPVGTVNSTERNSPTESFWDRLYNLSKWVWGLIMPHVETELSENDPHAPKNETPSLPNEFSNHLLQEKYTAEDQRVFISEMRHLISRIKDLNEEEFSQNDLESLLLDVYKVQIQQKQEQALDSKKLLTQEYTQKKELNKERLEKLEKIVSHAKTSKIWGLFEKGATTLGLVAASAGVTSGAGAVALLLCAGSVADQILDDPLKKKLAALVSSDMESENKWLERLKLGCGLASVAVYTGLGGPQAFHAAMNISKGAATAAKGITQHQQNEQEAQLKELGNRSSIADDKIKSKAGEIKRAFDSINDFHRNLAQITKNQLETSLSLISR